MPKNLWALAQLGMRRSAKKPAWICREEEDNRIVTHRELRDAALTLADRLRRRGVERGDSVGIIALNGPEFTAGALAVWKIGASLAPLHAGNAEEDIKAQIKALAPKVLLRQQQVGPALDFAGQECLISLLPNSGAIARENAIECEVGGDDLAVRAYTSGSTAAPKIARLSHNNLLSNVRAADNIERFRARDRFISLLPFSHIMGLVGTLLLPLSHGSVMVAPRSLTSSEVVNTLKNEKISVVIAVPKLFRLMMLAMSSRFDKGGDFLRKFLAMIRATPRPLRRFVNGELRRMFGGRIKAWVSGGAHLDENVCAFYHSLGLPLRQGYGLTETSPLTCMQERYSRALGSVGKPIEHVRIKINNPDKDGCGEVWIAGPNVMLGYEDDAQTKAAMSGEWFKSGDLGRIDRNGRLFLTGRLNRVIVTEAGKNVYPEELESLLERQPDVLEAGVVNVDNRPAAVLVMDGDDDDAPQRTRKMLAEFNKQVSSHNRIARFALVGILPRTPLGKTALRELPEVFAKHEVIRKSSTEE